MKIKLISIGQKMPDWVQAGFSEYQKRLPKDFSLELIEIPNQKRGPKAPIDKILALEGEALLAACPSGAIKIAFERQGLELGTTQVAQRLRKHADLGHTLCFLIGGPEGLAPSVLKQCQEQWSLSQLTLPHPLVRVLVAEQIYRAWSILNNHPYHR
jgi:23S rRNA (pseudouridine1915-N3)-methyltransferase